MDSLLERIATLFSASIDNDLDLNQTKLMDLSRDNNASFCLSNTGAVFRRCCKEVVHVLHVDVRQNSL